MAADLNGPTEDIVVNKERSEFKSKVGSEEFNKTLYKELEEGRLWRTSKALAEKLNVDVVELDNFLKAQSVVCSRPSKEEGVFLYALVKKLEVPEKNAKVEQALRPLVTEEDRYALASLHNALMIIEATLKKYALRIHACNAESFNALVSGKDKLEAGMVLFGNKFKADFSKLPKIE